MNPNPYDWTPAEIDAAKNAYDAAPEDATKAELRALVDAARAEVRAKPCAHRRITHTISSVQCTDCGAPIDTGCQHRHIDNDTWQCTNCGERMLSRSDKAETVISAPNAAPCRDPEHLAAIAAGEEFECSHPYVPDVSRQRTIVIGYQPVYTCERCSQDGTVMTAGEPISWDCGKWHEGDYISAREEVKA